MPDPEEHDIRMWVSLLLLSDDDGRGGGGGIRDNARLPSRVPLTFCGLASGARVHCACAGDGCYVLTVGANASPSPSASSVPRPQVVALPSRVTQLG